MTAPPFDDDRVFECIDYAEGIYVEVRCEMKWCDCPPLISHGLCHTHFWMLPLVFRTNLWRGVPGAYSDAHGWIRRTERLEQKR